MKLSEFKEVVRKALRERSINAISKLQQKNLDDISKALEYFKKNKHTDKKEPFIKLLKKLGKVKIDLAKELDMKVSGMYKDAEYKGESVVTEGNLKLSSSAKKFWNTSSKKLFGFSGSNPYDNVPPSQWNTHPEIIDGYGKNAGADIFKGFIRDKINGNGHLDSKVAKMIGLPTNVSIIDYLSDGGSGLNGNKNFKRFKTWFSALYDIYEEMEKKFGKAKAESVNEGASSEEKRIAMLAVKKQAKYRNVSLSQAIQDQINALEELKRQYKGK